MKLGLLWFVGYVILTGGAALAAIWLWSFIWLNVLPMWHDLVLG